MSNFTSKIGFANHRFTVTFDIDDVNYMIAEAPNNGCTSVSEFLRYLVKQHREHSESLQRFALGQKRDASSALGQPSHTDINNDTREN